MHVGRSARSGGVRRRPRESEIFKNKCNIRCTKWLHFQKVSEVWGFWWLLCAYEAVPLKEQPCLHPDGEASKNYPSTPVFNEHYLVNLPSDWIGSNLSFILQNLFLSEYTGAKPGGRVAVPQQLHVMDELKTDEAISNAVYSSSIKLKMSLINPLCLVVLNNTRGSFDGLNKWALLSRSTPPPEKSKDMGWTVRTIAMFKSHRTFAHLCKNVPKIVLCSGSGCWVAEQFQYQVPQLHFVGRCSPMPAKKPTFSDMVGAHPIFSHTSPWNWGCPSGTKSNVARVPPKCVTSCSLFSNTSVNWVSFLQLPSLLLQICFLLKWFLSNSCRPNDLMGSAPYDHSDEWIWPTLVSQPNSYIHPESRLVIINDYFCYKAQWDN